MKEYILPEMDDNNIYEHFYFSNLRHNLKIPKQKHSITVGRVTEIPIYSYTRVLSFFECIGTDGVHYKVRYAHNGNIKDKLITQKRFIKAYNKWYRRCWIEQAKEQ